MKITNCLKILFAVFFVVGLLNSTHAGQKEVVVSPKAGEAKVVPKKKVQRAPGAPKAEKAEPGKPKGKPKIMEYQPKKNWPEVMCQGKAPTFTGTSGDDTPENNPGMYGSLADDVIYGAGGNDTIKGNGGNDTLCGGFGGDALFGGLGVDILDGGPGWDICYGDDYDTFINCEKVIKQ